MRREAFSSMIVPDLPGSPTELHKIINLGFQKKRRRLANLNSDKSNIIAYSKGNEERLKKIVENLQLSEDEKKTTIDILIGLSGVKELGSLELPQIPEQEPTEVNLTNNISNKEKDKMLALPLQGMFVFAKKHRINIPDNIGERIFVVNEDIFNYLLMFVAGIDHQLDPIFIAGVTLMNRLCIINNDKISKLVGEGVGNYESIFQETCIHELWHSLSYKEKWLHRDNESHKQPLEEDFTRRAGLFTYRPGDISYKTILKSKQSYDVLHRLAEGFIEYMTVESLKKVAEKKNTHYAYPEETEFIVKLVGDIGISPFIQATFSKKGFATLMRALKYKYEEKYRMVLTYSDVLNLIDRELK